MTTYRKVDCGFIEGELGRDFGDRLRSCRKLRRLSLDALATASRVTRSHLWKLEKGDSQPSLAIVLKLAKAMGVGATALAPELAGNEAPDSELFGRFVALALHLWDQDGPALVELLRLSRGFSVLGVGDAWTVSEDGCQYRVERIR